MKEKKYEECSQVEGGKEVDKKNLGETKNANKTPIAPPRRKKKNKKQPDKTRVMIACSFYAIL